MNFITRTSLRVKGLRCLLRDWMASPVTPSLLQWWLGHAVAVGATHPLRVWQAREVVWSEQGGRSGGRQCFIEQHGMAVFYGGALGLQLAASVPVALLTALLCNVWDVTHPACPLPAAALMGLLAGLCRAPADHALLAAQAGGSAGAPLAARWLLLSAAREAAQWAVFAVLRGPLPDAGAGSGSVLVAALPSLAALAAASAAAGPLELLRCRAALASAARPPVVALEQLLGEGEQEAEGQEEGRVRRAARRWLLAGLPARLLHALLLFLVTAAWAFFLAFVGWP